MTVKTVGLKLKLFAQPAGRSNGADGKFDGGTGRERLAIGGVMIDATGRVWAVDDRDFSSKRHGTKSGQQQEGGAGDDIHSRVTDAIEHTRRRCVKFDEQDSNAQAFVKALYERRELLRLLSATNEGATHKWLCPNDSEKRGDDI